mmetsp:Transcript_14985/g.36531  ORF Transcript_14985/g.36531 Transcript_14985/m.36531 type:complete len:82 (-) Transcript_14985:1871-2116(-)
MEYSGKGISLKKGKQVWISEQKSSIDRSGVLESPHIRASRELAQHFDYLFWRKGVVRSSVKEATSTSIPVNGQNGKGSTDV